MTPLSTTARCIEPTLIRQLRDRAGPSSVDLGIGQPDLSVDASVRRVLSEALRDGRAPYSDNLGVWDTRQAIAAHYGVRPTNVMVTCGVQEALAVAVLGMVESGEEVLVPNPGFPAYPNLVRMAGARPVPYRLDTEADFRLVPDRIDRAITDKTSAIILNSPSNPTGAVHRRQDLEAVLARLATSGIRWISDEIYEDYVYEGDHVSVLADGDLADESGVKLGGLSKSHHMMGWRLGWLIGPAEWIEALKPLHQHLVTCAPTPAQLAAQHALARHQQIFSDTLQTFRGRRRLACRLAGELDDIEFVDPQGAFYLFLDVRAYTGSAPAPRGPSSSVALAESLLDTQDVVVIPGSGFGSAGEGFVRVAYTVEKPMIHEGFDRLGRFLASC